jgi:aspartate aminotransferase-like enzyme
MAEAEGHPPSIPLGFPATKTRFPRKDIMLLFTPGPTPVPEAVRLAMGAPTIHHRTPEFEEIFSNVRRRSLELLDMPECVILASSGTGAMEASVVNLCRGKALTVNAGKFGERFGKIVVSAGLKLRELEYSWDTPASVEDILSALKEEGDVDTLCIQICESAGGLRHPVEEISKAVKEYDSDIAVIADGITAVGVEKLDTSNIDALITGSQKALMLPPGLAMIGLSEMAVERIGGGRGYYFNLASEISKQRKGTTAYTAPTTLIMGLEAVFGEIEKNGGFERLYLETASRAKANEMALKAIGFDLYPSVPAPSMSAVFDEEADTIRTILKRDYGVNIAGGQDHLKGKLFRINQMGLIPVHEASWVVNAIEMALSDMGRRAYDGSASRVFNEVYFSEMKR